MGRCSELRKRRTSADLLRICLLIAISPANVRVIIDSPANSSICVFIGAPVNLLSIVPSDLTSAIALVSILLSTIELGLTHLIAPMST